jgi:hypothetical protein
LESPCSWVALLGTKDTASGRVFPDGRLVAAGV